MRVMKSRYRIDDVLLIVQLLVTHLLALSYVSIQLISYEYPRNWYYQICFLITLSICIGIIGILHPRFFHFSLLCSVVIYVVITYPYPGELLLAELLLINIIAQATMKEFLSVSFLIIFLVLGYIVTHQFIVDNFASKAFYMGIINDGGFEEWFSLLLYAMIAILLFYCIRYSRFRLANADEATAKLQLIVNRLTERNIEMQQNAITLRDSSVENERKRITGNIHDIVGYYITNLLMLLQAGRLLCKRGERQKTEEVFDKAIAHTKSGLSDVRSTFNQLYYSENKESLSNKIFEITNVFSELSSVRINLNFYKVPFSLGSQMDDVVIRFVQEGMTNSVKHGNPDSIDVSIRCDKNILELRISDDNPVSGNIMKGIGLTTMESRLGKVGGTLEISASSTGFILLAEIPLGGDFDG